jgi:polysaccharide deacetylase 2 family uncharacterized protein YibQ
MGRKGMSQRPQHTKLFDTVGRLREIRGLMNALSNFIWVERSMLRLLMGAMETAELYFLQLSAALRSLEWAIGNHRIKLERG